MIRDTPVICVVLERDRNLARDRNLEAFHDMVEENKLQVVHFVMVETVVVQVLGAKRKTETAVMIPEAADMVPDMDTQTMKIMMEGRTDTKMMKSIAAGREDTMTSGADIPREAGVQQEVGIFDDDVLFFYFCLDLYLY